MNKFKKYKIEDVCEFIGGSQPPKSTFINYPKKGYTRLVQTRDFKTDKFPTYIPTNSTTKFFNKEDIIIGRYGPPIFQIFRNSLEGAYNVALMKAVPKEKITNDFLYYFLTQKEVFEYVDKLSARTGGQTGVDLFSLYKYPINLPDKSEQKKIASVLSALDSKIELNNKINAELEAIAKTIYDYWFVQFDFPNSNGKPYKSSGGKMVWNEELKREIPKGWSLKKLNEVLTIKNGRDHKQLEAGSIPVFGSGGIMRYVNNSMYNSESVLIPRKGTLGNLFYVNEPFWCVDTIFYTQMKYPNSCKYLFYTIHGFNISSMNTGTAVPSMTTEILNNLILIFPPLEILKAFDKIVSPMFQKKNYLKFENQKLTELRDWLLPMLMNGQVKVR